MSDAKLWIDEVGCTVLVKNGSAIHILPLWVFESIRDIIVTEAEKEVEVTHHDFDIQQELLDRYRAENAKLRQQLEDVTVSMGRVEERCAKLRELAQRADRLLTDLFPHIDYSRCTALEAVAAWRVRARELGVEP